MEKRLSDVIGWFAYGWVGIILITDALRWTLWNTIGLPLHLIVREDTLLSLLSLGIDLIGNNTMKEFFPVIFCVWLAGGLINYVLIGKARFFPWTAFDRKP